MKIYRVLIVLLIAFMPFMVNSQDQKQNKESDIYYEVEEMPEYSGGMVAMRDYLVGAVKYPAEAKKKGIQGKVFVKFIIGKDGNVLDPKVEKVVNALLDKEAIRVISEMPKWKPGTEKGKLVAVQYTIPINFALQDCDSKEKSQ